MGRFARCGFGPVMVFAAAAVAAEDCRVGCTIEGFGEGVLRVLLFTETDMGQPGQPISPQGA
ncbi:MAG: hypothetical protein ACLFRY_03065 [Spirochaetia bacterium]